MTNVWINPQPMESGLVAVDVNIDGAPGDLFGAAFHVTISGVDWKLASYHLGTVFEGSEPFLMVSEKDGALITGISLRRAEPVTIRDGKLITFYVRPLEEAEISFRFDYPVLSIYDNGRRDIDAVQWLGATIFENIVTHEEPVEAVQESQVLSVQTAQADLLQTELTTSDPLSNMYFFLFISFFLFMVLMGLFSFYFWWTKK